MRIALAGAGAFGEKHLDGLKNIDGVEIASVISRRAEQAAEVAAKYGAPHSGGVRVGQNRNGHMPTPGPSRKREGREGQASARLCPLMTLRGSSAGPAMSSGWRISAPSAVFEAGMW